MSTSAIIWMIFFLGIVWGGLVALAVIAVTRDKRQKPPPDADSHT